MSADKANKHKLRSKLNYNHQPIIVALDIENVALVAYIVNRVERLLDVCQCLPTALLHFLNPILNCSSGLRMLVCILFERLFGKYSHSVEVLVGVANLRRKFYFAQSRPRKNARSHIITYDWNLSLFIDRDFKRVPNVDRLEKLCLGSHISEFNHNLSGCENLDSIFCYSLIPPTTKNFSNFQYMNTIVCVPNETLEAYRQADGWKNFWNLEGFDAGNSAIEPILSNDDKLEIGRYNLYGKEVSDTYTGVVIIRYSDGTCKKMVKPK